MWQNAVRKAARSAAEKEAAIDVYDASPPRTISFNYLWEHVRAVAALADKLGQILEADLEVLEAAAWLHDVTKVDGEQHAATAAEFARQLLTKTDFPKNKIDQVARTIADHVGLWRDKPLSNLHSQILWDADKLSKLGLTFSVHLTGMVAAGNKPTSTRELIISALESSRQKKTIQCLHTQP